MIDNFDDDTLNDTYLKLVENRCELTAIVVESLISSDFSEIFINIEYPYYSIRLSQSLVDCTCCEPYKHKYQYEYDFEEHCSRCTDCGKLDYKCECECDVCGNYIRGYNEKYIDYEQDCYCKDPFARIENEICLFLK